ncbi:MAG: phage tail assembly protein T [Pseudonocardiaceae bacterium]
MPRGELLRRMSSAELTDWMAYEQVAGPLGGERQDLLNAMLTAVVARTAGNKLPPEDFMPRWNAPQAQSWQQQKATVMALNRFLGGTMNRRGAA